uniref:hypothetical protein n=1 Tax=Ensifer adhaerens TaxID=106592 RepID=UPI003F494757
MAGPKKNKVAESETTEIDMPTISITGDFASQVGVVSGTSMTLFVGVGEVEGETNQVLVPLVSWGLAGGNDVVTSTSSSRLYSSVLTLENAAFVACDTADELRKVLTQLTIINTGGIKVEPARLQVIAGYLDGAKQAIELCQGSIQNLIASGSR